LLWEALHELQKSADALILREEKWGGFANTMQGGLDLLPRGVITIKLQLQHLVEHRYNGPFQEARREHNNIAGVLSEI